jgi:hypothetical protein
VIPVFLPWYINAAATAAFELCDHQSVVNTKHPGIT